MNTYNGWSNRDTWACNLILSNNEKHYKNLVYILNTSTIDDLKEYCKHNIYDETIDFNNVDYCEIFKNNEEN
jgi:hypothetical protein